MARLKISTLVVAPLLALAHQWVDRIRMQLGYDAGMVGDRVRNLRPVTVTTYASACIQMPVLGNCFGLVVFDECHHLPAPVLGDAARMSAAPLRLGLTATPPCEPDRRAALEALIGPIVYELPITAVRGRAIADYEIIRIPTPLSDAERANYRRCIVQLRRYAAEVAAASCRSGSAGKTEAAAAGSRNHVKRTLLGDPGLDPVSRLAITAYRRKRALENAAESKLTVLGELFGLHLGEPCLVFTGSNAAALAVSRRFLIPCLLNHTSRRERREILAGFGEGRFPAVVANRVLDEGIDLPDVKVAIVLGGTASSRQAQQRLGRLLRKRGASKAVLYEIVTAATPDEWRARRRASNDAYQGTCCRRR
jgi:superfamily II DNA or RNA helicase